MTLLNAPDLGSAASAHRSLPMRPANCKFAKKMPYDAIRLSAKCSRQQASRRRVWRREEIFAFGVMPNQPTPSGSWNRGEPSWPWLQILTLPCLVPDF